MKTLNFPIKFMVYAISRAVRHPKTLLVYYYCSDCKLRFNAKEPECPKCHAKIGESPENRKESPVPWWSAMLCILMGVGAWIVSAVLNIPPLGEAARILIYVPLGHLFGMSLQR